MSQSIYSLVSELPETLQNVLKSIGYHRKDIELIASKTVSQHISGGAGYRGFCIILDLASGNMEERIGSWGGSNMFSPDNPVDNNTEEYNIPYGVAVIKGSQGEKVFASVYLNPDNMIKYLPAKVQLDPRDAWILYTFDGLTSAGRKDQWRRDNDIPSEDDLNRLAALGYLKRSKNGATQITTEGRNALGRRPGLSIDHP